MRLLLFLVWSVAQSAAGRPKRYPADRNQTAQRVQFETERWQASGAPPTLLAPLDEVWRLKGDIGSAIGRAKRHPAPGNPTAQQCTEQISSGQSSVHTSGRHLVYHQVSKHNYRTVQHRTVSCNSSQCGAVQHSTVQYTTVWCRMEHLHQDPLCTTASLTQHVTTGEESFAAVSHTTPKVEGSHKEQMK